MADKEAAGAMPATPGATPNTPDQPDTPAPAAAMADPEQLGEGGKVALQREREAREAAEKTARDLTKRLKAYEDKDKSESEKATERIAQLEQDLANERTARQSMALQIAALASARKLGFRDPDLARRLLTASEIEFDDDGQPKNVDRLLGDIAKQYPALVSTTTDYGGGPRGTPPVADDMNARIRRQAGRA